MKKIISILFVFILSTSISYAFTLKGSGFDLNVGPDMITGTFDGHNVNVQRVFEGAGFLDGTIEIDGELKTVYLGLADNRKLEGNFNEAWYLLTFINWSRSAFLYWNSNEREYVQINFSSEYDHGYFYDVVFKFRVKDKVYRVASTDAHDRTSLTIYSLFLAGIAGIN